MRKILKKKDRNEILDGKILLRCTLEEERRYKINQVNGWDMPESLRECLRELNNDAEKVEKNKSA